MRASQYLIATQKESPADAEVISHQLMLRAGMIRKVASGLYSWLPLGLRVFRKVENIVRQEMDKAGAMELLMPVVQPADLWEESGRSILHFCGYLLLDRKDVWPTVSRMGWKVAFLDDVHWCKYYFLSAAFSRTSRYAT